jgi:HEAT repeat protein
VAEPDYVEKLIAALRHEEPETTVRAAWILGRIADRRAVGPLIDAAGRGGDPEFLAAVVEALGRIGDPAL